jgi:hypothetical protein
MILYVHGAGQTGRAAWPAANSSEARFADFSGSLTVPEKVSLLGVLGIGADVVVAHSAGAIPTVMAVESGLLHPAALVLVEPALYDIARGNAAVESHIGTMVRARHLARQGDLRGYWSIVRPMMFGGPSEPDSWTSDQALAEQFFEIKPPWGYDVRAESIRGTATVVVTGGWNAEYEAIADVLKNHGAHHEVIAGWEHRPQDSDKFAALLADIERAAAGRTGS